MRSCNKYNSAFTTIELLVSFGIFALIIGITFTVLRLAGPGSVLGNTARDLTTDLRYASQLATSTQINHAVRFDPALRSYEIIMLSTPTSLRKFVSLNENIHFTSITLPQNQAEFNTLGAAVNPGEITLQYQNGPTTIIEIRPSGYVRVQ